MAHENVAVYVGYADNLRPNSNFPIPWRGSPNVVFQGGGNSFDAGAIRIDNLGLTAIAIDSVVVDLQRPGPRFNLWGSFTVPPGQVAILTQTGEYNFDTSDYQFLPCGAKFSP